MAKPLIGGKLFKEKILKEEKWRLNDHLYPHSGYKFHYTAAKVQASHANSQIVCRDTGMISVSDI